MLSGGARRRAAVARALACHPSVILANEPTATLDCDRGRQVMELFRTFARKHAAGVTVVTYDQRTLDVFDTIYKTEDGVIHQSKHQDEPATEQELIQKQGMPPTVPALNQPSSKRNLVNEPPSGYTSLSLPYHDSTCFSCSAARFHAESVRLRVVGQTGSFRSSQSSRIERPGFAFLAARIAFR